VDFRGREVSFQEANRRYAQLARQRDAGSISDEEFDAQRQQLMVQDGEGRWWTKLGEPGEWHYHDGSAWVRGAPPDYQEATNPADSPVQTPSPLYPKGVETGRQRVPRWIPAAGLVGLLLVGTVLIVWVLIPYLRGGPTASKQGGPMMSEQGGSAPGGAAFDALFVHHATSENISGNSTYLDNPLTNGYPNAILYITQNWNPGGSAGTYNNHPIGVWYDPERQRWAIFNQDRESMPDGAAFNVAVSKDPTKVR
jgi:hypothetical protein